MNLSQVGFDVGKACQDIYNVYESGRALYNQADLINGIVQQISLEECVALRVFEDTMRSGIFLFQDYRFNIKELGEKFQVRAIPLKNDSEALNSLFLRESFIRTASGIKVLVEVLFASISIAGSFYQDCAGACKTLHDAWKAGVEVSSKESSRIENPFPKESEASHITKKDIEKIKKHII